MYCKVVVNLRVCADLSAFSQAVVCRRFAACGRAIPLFSIGESQHETRYSLERGERFLCAHLSCFAKACAHSKHRAYVNYGFIGGERECGEWLKSCGRGGRGGQAGCVWNCLEFVRKGVCENGGMFSCLFSLRHLLATRSFRPQVPVARVGDDAFRNRLHSRNLSGSRINPPA